MALDEPVLLELLGTLKAADVEDPIRLTAQAIYLALIEAELSAMIGAGRHERTAERSNHRNEHRPRVLTTPAGDQKLQIPKLRVGSFFPSLLERRRRVDQALFAVDEAPSTGDVIEGTASDEVGEHELGEVAVRIEQGGRHPGPLHPEKWIVKRESGFSPTAANSTSSAFGIVQLILANRRRYAPQVGADPADEDYPPARPTRASSYG